MINKKKRGGWLVLFGLILIIACGAYFRFVGINWDDNYHLHPDERFLTMVETAIRPVESAREYFDTNNSALNPHNVVDVNGNQTFPFFVYGTLPIFLVRYIGEFLNQTSYSEIHIIGRYLSGIFDLGTIIFVFFIAKDLFQSNRNGLFAALFYACAALPIQISHFFIVDNFTTFFTMLAFLAAVRVMHLERSRLYTAQYDLKWRIIFKEWKGVGYFVIFSVALGFAAASKINAVVAAVLLPAAILLSDPINAFKLSDNRWKIRLRNLAFAGVLSLIVFRIFQPYAFSGPGFINFSLNPKWISNLKELTALSSGLSNYPPSLQWARRSIFFPIKNMIIWGMGVPFGVLSIVGLFMMVREVVKGKWKRYGLLVGWNLIYLLWQAINWNPTMRYFLLVYPALAITAGWIIDCVLIKISTRKIKPYWLKNFLQLAFVLIILIYVTAWASAFVNIYRQPMTRIEASKWIYRNLEGAINLRIENDNGEFSQPIPYPKYYELNPGKTLSFDFIPQIDISIYEIAFDHIVAETSLLEDQHLAFTIYTKDNNDILTEIEITDSFRVEGDARGQSYQFDLPNPVLLEEGKDYIFSLRSLQSETKMQFSGTISVVHQIEGKDVYKRVFEFAEPMLVGEPYRNTFTPIERGELLGIDLFRVRTCMNEKSEVSFTADVKESSTGQILSTGKLFDQFSERIDFRGQRFSIVFEEPIILEPDVAYELSVSIEEKEFSSPVFLYGSKTAKETDWDDTLPLFMYGLNPFDNYSGVYQSDLNFQMYWDDNADKLSRFISILDQADYIVFSSNRQWGSITQIPEKYPLSMLLYKEIIGCNLTDVQRCYKKAEPGIYSGNLGYELIETFQSEPEILGIEINTQFAEEAFTVYDHPKVFIFKKSEDFSFETIISTLSIADLDKVLNISPQEAENRPGILNLPEEIWDFQKSTGTWADLFDYHSLQNEYPLISVLVWYSGITILGWMVYPIIRIAFRGLDRKGWPILRIAGLVILTFFVWIAGSFGVHVTRLTIFSCILILFVINGFLFFIRKKEIIQELSNNLKSIIFIELVILIFFILFLLIRIGNPDLWHPYKGGEKPMDFSYFNALIKSISYPPYDPWYAGGYINYYYWGFLIAAIPTKILGIIPSIAYNLVLPSFFSFTASSAFCVGWNLSGRGLENSSEVKESKCSKRKILSGLVAAVFVLIIGNLGTIKMIVQGFQRLSEIASLYIDERNFNTITSFFEGIRIFIKHRNFNYYPGDWYWIPSRTIPGEPITEFPYFTFLYGDPHAHMFALTITLLALSWTISFINERMQYERKWEFPVKLLIGGIVIGALRPTNTWDYPVFLVIACGSILYIFIKYAIPPKKIFPNLTVRQKTIFLGILSAISFGLISYFLYYPFSKWYGQGYASIDFWTGKKTPLGSYLTHWGYFVFIIYSWLLNEVKNWMRITPLSAINKFYPYRKGIIAGFLLILTAIALLVMRGVEISVLVIPAVAISGLLLFRKGNSEKQRFILILTCIGSGLTLMVELVVITGDIGRMNTVFKFYLQAWTCLAISSSWYLSQLLANIKNSERKNAISGWITIILLLSVSVILFPVIASADKINDRISKTVPVTLDGMEYMRYSSYTENNQIMDLKQDYELIHWMQDNINGTPIIIEANVPEYRWGNRITIYTGLPGVIGWNWHQRQQRAINPSDWVFKRVEDVNAFYSVSDISVAKDLVEKYKVDYIVIGQLEKIVYPQKGIDKFFLNANGFLELIYSSEDTNLFMVVQ
jgi:YYY domain-containing protein